MNTFPVRRLIPFFVVTVISEGLYLLLQLINNFGNGHIGGAVSAVAADQ